MIKILIIYLSLYSVCFSKSVVSTFETVGAYTLQWCKFG